MALTLKKPSILPGFGLALGYTSYSAMSVWLAYTSWIPNVMAVLTYSAIRRSRSAIAKSRTGVPAIAVPIVRNAVPAVAVPTVRNSGMLRWNAH